MADDAMEKEKAEKEKQARKAHAFAEKCFLAGNVLAAKMWMQSAVRLAPDLPGAPQIVAAYDVHLAASRSTRCWYDVLGLKPTGRITHDDIKKQHRRLCLLVHPDKNPSAAADGAFKLIQAAWHALLATHPPLGGAAVPAPPPRPAAPPPRPPQPQRRPPPEPQPRPRPWRPAPQRTPRRAWPEPPTYPQQAEPQKSKCPACGAHTINWRNNTPTLIGRNNYRCMSCRWSPKDGRRDPHEDDCQDDIFDDCSRSSWTEQD